MMIKCSANSNNLTNGLLIILLLFSYVANPTTRSKFQLNLVSVPFLCYIFHYFVLTELFLSS